MANLIVYFSHAGQNWVNGEVVTLEKGNTCRAAEIIREAVGGDLFEVRAKEPYPEDYQALVARTKEEFENGLRPELAEYPASLEDYDLIFVGYPNWWNTMPGPMFTFLSHYDLSGRRLAPFCTNEGGSMGMGEREMARLYKGAVVLPGLAVHGADIESAQVQDRIAAWARKTAGTDGAGS